MAQSVGKDTERPISPHLMQYRWGVHMMASITHRITGFILATVGMMTLVWWLSAISGGMEGYAAFQTYAINAGDDATLFQKLSNWFFWISGLVIIYAFFQHFFSGLRHLIMDMGAGFELNTSRTWSQVVFILAFLSTAITAIFIYARVIGA